jgi:hypothetical protein
VGKKPGVKECALAVRIERHTRPPDIVAEPGPVRLAPYMREIADAIRDPAIERVSVLRSEGLRGAGFLG